MGKLKKFKIGTENLKCKETQNDKLLKNLI